MLWRRIITGLALALFVGVGLIGGMRSAQAAPQAAPHLISKQILSETSIDGPALSKNDIGHEGDRAMVMAWTGTDSLHRLNLLTTNDGKTWINKRTLSDTSFVRPAVDRMPYMAGGEVILAWTGTDSHHSLNVIWDAYNVNHSYKKVTFWGDNSFTAPAIAVGGDRIYLVWAGTDANHSLNIMALAHRTLAVKTPKKVLTFSSSARPSIALGPSTSATGALLLGWTNGSKHVSFAIGDASFQFGAAKVSSDTSSAGPDFFAADSSYIGDTVTPKYWWAWTGQDTNHSIHVAFNRTTDWPPSGNKATLGEWALGGPILAWRGDTNKVIIAWTGTDPQHHLNIGMVSAA